MTIEEFLAEYIDECPCNLNDFAEMVMCEDICDECKPTNCWRKVLKAYNVDLPRLDETNRNILEVSREYKAAKENGDEKKMRELEKYVSDTYGAPIDRVLFDARVLEEELK